MRRDGSAHRILTRRTAALLLACLLGWAQQTPTANAEVGREIVIGVEASYPPYSFAGDDGQPTGFNVELTRAVAQVTGLNVRVRLGPWNEIRQALETGEIDAICGMFYSPHRDEQVDFSPPFTTVHHGIFIRDGSAPVQSENELKGRRLIVMRGDIMHDYAVEKGLAGEADLIVKPTLQGVIESLAHGEGDYALAARLPGLYWAHHDGHTNVVTTGPTLCPFESCYAVAEGNEALRARLAEGLAIVRQSNLLPRIRDRWLGADDPGTHATSSGDRIRIGVLAKRGARRCLEQWGLTAEYLTHSITGYRFEIVPLAFEDVESAVVGGTVDFVLVNSAMFADLSHTYGAQSIATLKNLRQGNVVSEFGGVIFCRAEVREIQSLRDIRNRTIAAVSSQSFGGWLMALREMRDAGIRRQKDFHSVHFLGTHDAVVYAVRDGEVDLGVVRSDTFERMAAEGVIRTEDFRVINPQPANDTFPFARSTRLYPEWPFAAMPHVPQKLTERVASALLAMSRDAPAARAAQCAGWTVPRNYEPVHQCLRELGVRPYVGYGKVSVAEALRQHWHFALATAGALCLMGLFAAFSIRLNRKLKRSLSEQLRVERQLAESRTFLRTVVDAIPEPLTVIDLNYNLLLVNHAGAQASELDDPVVCGMKCHQLSHHRDTPCDGDDHPCPVRQCMSNGQPCSVVHLHQVGGKTKVVEVNAAPVRNEHGDIVQIIEVCRDITDQHNAQEMVRRQAVLLQTVLNAVPSPVYHADHEGTVLGCNRMFAELIAGLSEDRIIREYPRVLSERVSIEVARQSVSDDEHLQRTGGVVSREWPIRCADGETRQFKVVKAAYRGANGDVAGLVGVLLDVTEKNRMLSDLSQSRVALEQSNRELTEVNARLEEAMTEAQRLAAQAARAAQIKTDFLANMSHEIRTPLTAILGFADMLAEPDESIDREDCVQEIRRNGSHLLTLVNDVLDLSKIEAGRLTLEMKPCSTVDLIEQAVSMMRSPARQKQNTLAVEYATEIPERILTDEHRFRQILLNLLGNAVKFTEGGTVTLSASYDAVGCEGAPALRMAIRDTGVGMEPDVVQRLGEPFVQGDTSVTRQFGGTGLGLTITRRLLDAMDGQLDIESRLGEGSTFTVTLPLGRTPGALICPSRYRLDVSPDPTPASAAPPSLAGMKLLLAEDNKVNQKLVGTLLTKAGADVTIAGNGRQALEHVRRDTFDLVLLDMQMPILDGYSAARQMRSEGFTLPIIALTAHAMEGDARKCLDAGCDEYIAKPIDKAVLLNTIVARVPSRQPV